MTGVHSRNHDKGSPRVGPSLGIHRWGFSYDRVGRIDRRTGQMTKKELVEHLEQFPDDMEVFVWCGSCGEIPEISRVAPSYHNRDILIETLP